MRKCHIPVEQWSSSYPGVQKHTGFGTDVDEKTGLQVPPFAHVYDLHGFAVKKQILIVKEVKL